MFGKLERQKYKVIYADPPWDFKVWSKKGAGRSAERHYGVPPFEQLANMPVIDLADPTGCVLLMWATDPLLDKAFELIARWGFEYKTVGFYWVKLNKRFNSYADYFTGLGYWTRSNPEQCLLATLGKPKRHSKGVHSVVVSPVRDHSRKPDEVHGRVQRLLYGPYCELFARREVEGWDCWGDQTGKYKSGFNLFQ